MSHVDETCGHGSPVVSRTFQIGSDQVTWSLCKDCKNEPEFLEFIVNEKRVKKDSQSSASTPRTPHDTRGNQHV